MIRFFIIYAIVLSSIQVSSQCYPERHNTTKNSGWISCVKKASPNAARGSSHWILYQFNEPKSIEGIKIWNSNLHDVSDLAIKDLIIDYSMDGASWNELGNFLLSSPHGDPFYEGEELADVQAFSATHILLTGASVYDSQCAGLAEVKFSLNNSTTATDDIRLENDVRLSPNPAFDQVNVTIENDDFQLQRIDIVNVTGQILYTGPEKSRTFQLNVSELIPGAYFIHLIGDQATIVKKLQIIKP